MSPIGKWLRRCGRSAARVAAWVSYALSLAAASPAFATTAGPNSPTACADTGTGGQIAWNPTNAMPTVAKLDGTKTTPQSNYFQCTGFGFAIPAGATITGITVTTNRVANVASAAKDFHIQLVKGGTIQTTDKATATFWPTTAGSASYGSATDLWGNTWTVADINAANFGAAVAVQAPGAKVNATLNSVTISVDYTAPATTAGAFNAFETSTAAGSTSGPIWTKISGAAFSLDVVALDSTKTTLQSGFSGNIEVYLVGNINTGVSLDANGCPVTTGLNQTVSTSLAMSGARQTVSFPAVADAWRDVRVKIRYPAGSPTVTSCSGDNFAIRPNSLLVSVTDATRTTAGTTRTLNAVNLTDTTVHNAAQPFTVSITGQNAVGATTVNYSANPPTDVLAVTLGTCGGTACPSTFGSFALGSATSSGGTVTANAASYTDVGSFTLTIQDQSFANVDAADSTTAQRYISSSAINAGRFVPDHFTLITAGASAPTLTNRADIATCYPNTTGSIASASTTLTVASASGISLGDVLVVHGAGTGGSDLTATVNAIAGTTITISVAASVTVSNSPVRKQGFTYFNEPFAVGFRLEARNASEAVTANYAATLARMNPSSAASYGFGARNSPTDLSARLAATPSGAWSAGVLTPTVSLTFSRLATEDGPYSALDIGIAPTDPDGTALAVFDLDVNGDATNDHAKLAQTMVRFGRLRLQNAFGSELLDLPVPISAEYFTGGAYVISTDDNCTSIATSNLSLSSGTATIGGAFQAGKGNLKITAPGAPVSIDLCVDLDVSSGTQNDSTCVATTPANQTYLQWKWSGATFTLDPKARAVFGVYKNANEFIYLRENY